MSVKVMILLCALTAVLAYPQPYAQPNQEDLEGFYPEPTFFVEENNFDDGSLSRVRRQLVGGGGGSPGQGFGFGLQGQAPVWKSDNGRHQVDATGSYSQHLGGPYGNSKPNWGVGAIYRYKF